jgi:hypothetical protein
MGLFVWVSYLLLLLKTVCRFMRKLLGVLKLWNLIVDGPMCTKFLSEFKSEKIAFNIFLEIFHQTKTSFYVFHCCVIFICMYEQAAGLVSPFVGGVWRMEFCHHLQPTIG